jgi:hypothetical protein
VAATGAAAGAMTGVDRSGGVRVNEAGKASEDTIDDPTTSQPSWVRLKPVGFWSYSRQDDELSQGRLSGLRSLLMSEIQQQYGRDRVQLFQDVSAISAGAEWEREIRNSLNNSTFFIPIITPNFIQSEWCCAEVNIFLQREKQLFQTYPDLPQRSRIFPLQMIDITGVDPYDRHVLAALEKRQWIDFRPLRFRSLQDEAVQRALAEFASSIRDLLHIKVRRPLTEAEKQKMAEAAAAAAAAAEAERQRREAEEQRVLLAKRQEEQSAAAQAAAAREAEERRRAAEQAERERQENEARLARERQEAEAQAAWQRQQAEQQAAWEQQQAEARAEQERRAMDAQAERDRRAAEAAELAEQRRQEREARRAAGETGWLEPPKLFILIGGIVAAILIALLAYFVVPGLFGGDEKKERRSRVERPASEEDGPQNKAAPAATEEEAEPPAPANAWLFRRWGVEGNCRASQVISGNEQQMTIRVGSASDTERVVSASDQEVVTNVARYVRSGENVVRTETSVNFSYRLTPCP